MLLEKSHSLPSSIENWRQCFPEIVGRSAVMNQVLATVAKVARSESSVLVLGESGTGKELIAAAIHRLSQRSHRAFIPLNCSAIPDTLLESELFGHEKGAFTGADRRRAGHFEVANHGTIFLDEIGDMPQSLQAKLLRVLQDRRFTPLGGSQTKEADVRIIAATNKELEQEVRKGEFRLDLYYRLNVLPIHLPPLRERRDDIPPLLDHFVEAANRMQGVAAPCFFSDELVHQLGQMAWPGNVRQLQNLVERLVVMKGGGCIGLDDLPREMIESIGGNQQQQQQQQSAADRALLGASEQRLVSPSKSSPVSWHGEAAGGDGRIRYPDSHGALPPGGFNLTQYIESLENDYIRQALERTGNNKNKAAKLLGLNRTTLVERIKKRKILPLNLPSKEL